MSTAIASHRPRLEFISPPLSPLSLHASTLAEVEGIAPVRANRSGLLSGLQITDQRLLLNEYQALNQQIQGLMDRQPTRTDSLAEQPGQASEEPSPLSPSRFWTEARPGEVNPEPAQNQLLAIHRQMLSTLAALLVEDGTLSLAAKALIDTAFEHPTLAERERAIPDGERPGVYPLKLDTPMPDGTLMAGSFLITRADGSSPTRRYDSPDADRTLQPGDQQGLTVLYTPRDGFEVFNTPAQALQRVRRRIADDPDAAQQFKHSLPLATQHSLKPGWENQLSQALAPLHNDVIAAGVQQLLEGLEQGADLAPHFDGSDALWARNERLLERLDSLDARQALGQHVENQKNWQYLAQQLALAAQRLPETATPREVAAVLKSAPMNVAPGSAQHVPYILEPGKAVTLEAFMVENGLPLPTTQSELLALARTVAGRALQHPFGNFGGALSWPIPLSASEQQVLRATAIEQASQASDSAQEPAAQGLLDYLNRHVQLSGAALEDPVKVLETLVTSSEGQALGRAAQAKLNGIATDTSVNDYTLAAIQLALDPESITTPGRNRVAGFDLAAPQYAFQPPSVVVEGLRQHLIDTERVSPALAQTAAHALLMRAAPQFLVKDIPDTVLYGSQAWANLCIAVAAGGKGNNFAEVMVNAAGLGAAPEAAQRAALVDWGVANNLLDAKDDALYTQADIDKVHAAFMHQQATLQEGSALQDTVMPDRRQMAMDLLKQTFGDTVSFEDKVFSRLSDTFPPKPGKPYSMLDIVMEQVQMDSRWSIKKGTEGVDLKAFVAFTKSPAFNIQETFDKAFSVATDNHKQIKKLSVINALTNLSPEDKKNLSTGQLKYYQEKSYRISTLPFVGPTLFHTSPKILVTAQNGSTLSKYEFDTEKGVIRNIGNRPVPRDPEYVADEVSKVEEFFPDIDKSKTVEGLRTFASYLPFNPALTWVNTDSYKRDRLDEEQPSTASAPYMFVNPRAHHIADSIVKALDLDNPAIRKAAAGTTSSEQRAEQTHTLRDAFLDLIPFRSAIVNFRDGNYSEGINDVAFDIFGFITAGFGAAAKAGRALSSTGSALGKALKVTKIMVPPLLKELNPLEGVGDVVMGAGKVLYEAGTTASNGLRTLKGTAGRDALRAASNRYDAAALGTFKIDEQAVQGSAVQHNGQWYAYDALTQKPYGPPMTFSSSNTLIPQSPILRVASRTEGVRHNPLSRSARPAKPTARVPLPMDEYVTSKQTNGALIPDHFTPDRIKFTRQKFTLEKNGHLQDFVQGGGIQRPTIPEIAGETPNELVAKALEQTDVLVFGDNHDEIASLIVIRDAMPTLKEGQVEAIFMEGISLDEYGLNYDRALRHGNPERVRLYEEVLAAAEKYGIEVMPLEHRYLTRHADAPGYFDGLSTLPRASPERMALSRQRLDEVNYYGAKQVLKNELGGKSVVWVGRSHMNTSEGVPGIAELTGGIGIGVYQKPGIEKSVGRKAEGHPDPLASLSVADDTAGDLQIDIKV